MTSLIKIGVNYSHGDFGEPFASFSQLVMTNNSSLDGPEGVIADQNGPILFPFYTRLIMTIFGSLILLVGIVGNILVPSVVWTNKCMRSSTNLFLVNLSVADLLVLLICIPTVLIEVHTKPETWMLGQIMCKVVPFVEFTVAHVSVLTILAISFERYYAVCYPLEAGYTCTRGRALIIVVSVWLISAALTTPIVFITEFWYADYVDNTTVPVCTMHVHTLWRKLYFVCSTAIFFVLPMVILVSIYVIVCRNLTEDKLFCGRRSSKSQSCDKSEDSSLKCRRQVVVMLIAIVLCFFVCLLPLRAFHLWIIFIPLNSILSMSPQLYYGLLFSCRSLTYLNSAINPVIYNLISSKFRDAFCKHLRLKRFRGSFLRSSPCKLSKTMSSSNSTSVTVTTYIYENPHVEYSGRIFPRPKILKK